MLIRKIFLGAAFVVAAAMNPAATAAEIVVGIAPPPLRVEVVPAPRAGNVWVAGHWGWRDGRHVWIEGHWIKERTGYHWNSAHWDQRNGRWYLVDGRWAR